MTTSDRSMLEGFSHVGIQVADIERSVRFYRDTLGLKFLFDAANMAFFDCNGVRLMLTISEQPESTYSSILYYKTENIQRASEQLRSRGAIFESPARMIAKMPDHELWMAFLRDTEGNLLALMSEVR